VSTETQSLSSWLRRIPGDLYQLDEKPLLGFAPEFPWAAFSTALANSLQIQGLSVQPGNLEWRKQAELFDGLGDRLKTLELSITPIAGPVWWVMPELALLRLMHRMLAQNSEFFSDKIDEGFFKAFYQFLALEVINAFGTTGFDKELAPNVLKLVTLPSDACLCLDISIALGDESIHGRLFLSQEFRRAWMQRYEMKEKQSLFSSPLADSLSVIVHLEAGKVHLKPSEWQQISPGDFIILDTCSLEPEEDKGRVMLVINGHPFFRAKIKQGSLKILEHPLQHEVDITMPNPPNNNDDADDTDLDDMDFDLDNESHEHDEDTDHDLSSDSHADQDSTSLDTTDHDELTEDFDDENEKETRSILEKKPKKSISEDLKAASTSKPPITVDDIPLVVVVEVGRIQMSVRKLLELQPGNMIDLDIHPESGIDMVVNGKRIARGELLKIGDALGVRITELS